MISIDGKRIAVVDDDPLFLDHVSSILMHKAGVRAVLANSAADLFKKIDDAPVSCIVLDYDLGLETGLSIGQAIKEKYADPPPIIMLTGAGSERIATKAFRVGFSDYISKRNLDPKELIAAVTSAMDQHERQQTLHAETVALRNNQRMDSLTGIFTSQYLATRLEEVTFGNSDGFTLFTVGIEGFALLQSHVGHSAAQMALRDFASRLKQIKIGDGYLAHLGTSAFACVFERQLSDDDVKRLRDVLIAEGAINVSLQGSSTQLVPNVNQFAFPRDASSVPEILRLAVKSDIETLAQHAQAIAAANAVLPHNPADRRDGEEQPVDEERRDVQRRGEQRHRVLKRGKIIFDGLNTILDCTIRNVSASGAHIRVEGYFASPARFKLQIVGSGEPRVVGLRWQIGGDIGVAFEDQAE